MRATAWWLALLVLGVLAACTPDEDDTVARRPPQQADPSQAGSEPVSVVEGGVVVIAVPDTPATLNPWLADPDSSVGVMARPMLAPLWRVMPDGTSEPWLLADEPTVSGDGQEEPFSVTYRIRDEAVWSDGHPIDGNDVLFTLQSCRDVMQRDDCADVDVERSRAEGRQATVVFEQPTARWRTILSTLPVLPEHELRGQDLTTAWSTRVTVSSGPFRFSSLTPDQRLVLVRNDRWWGEPARLDRLEFAFEPPHVDAVADGAVDVAAMPAAPDLLAQARSDSRVRVDVEVGRRWLALDFNGATPALRTPDVRRALAQALDRETIIGELIRPVSSEPSVPTTLPGGPPAADAQTPGLPAHDVTAAARALDAAGCTVGGDGIRVCEGQPLELTLALTDDDWQQSILAEYVQTQLADIGVSVVRSEGPPEQPTQSPPGEGELSEPASGDLPEADPGSWDLRISTVTTAQDPADGGRRWRCGDPVNTQSFCAPLYDTLMRRAAGTLDGGTRSDLHAQAALLLAQQLPTYPLYEIPALVVHADSIQGPEPNAGPWALTWNVEEWVRTTR